MNESPDTILEQLSAFMDGELPAAESRFLQRRLDADPQLRARWARMQVAATCIKGQPLRPMAAGVSDGVRSAIADSSPLAQRHPILRWGVAASVMALAVMFAPALLRDDAPAVGGSRQVASTALSGNVIASPASADLVASQAEARQVAPIGSNPATPATGAVASADVLLAGTDAPSAAESPLPLAAQSPTEFPLVEGSDKRSWPRSGLARDSDDPALEAYLVRHNQLLANDGLGGFVPYVDVVSSDKSGGAGEKAAALTGDTGDAKR